jgi:uncharacterized membrane protein
LLVCLLLFLLFLNRCLHRLRPVAVATLAANRLRHDFAQQEAALAGAPDIFWGDLNATEERPTLVVRSAEPGAIQAVNVRGLLKWAREHNQLVAVRHEIGDFVPANAAMIEVYGDGVGSSQDESALRGMVALGEERTLEQDSAFAIRIMVDVANKALSPAVNDPTSAVQVIDHLSDVLRLIGTVDISSSRWEGERGDRTGLVIPVRGWDEFLSLATTEIREYGASSIQVMRRMRAMLVELYDEVRPENRAAVEAELARLDATVLRSFGESVDLDRAGTPDAQGIGGRSVPRDLSPDSPQRGDDRLGRPT